MRVIFSVMVGVVSTEHVKHCIVGAGPSGLQLGQFFHRHAYDSEFGLPLSSDGFLS